MNESRIYQPDSVTNLFAASKDAAASLKEEMLASFNLATCHAANMSGLDIPFREPVIGEWLLQGDLGFIYGERGLGKTWLAMLVARRIAEGKCVGQWAVRKPRHVLYVDGEMAWDSICKRDSSLKASEGNISYLQHEALFHKTGKVLNLTNQAAQSALLEKCTNDGIEVLILDNLSCLFAGMKENEADAWEQVLPWLLNLRRNRIAVIFVAHAGRNGFMRGTSRREDAAFWVIRLTGVQNATEIQNGANFVSRFTKNRNSTETECPPLEWKFICDSDETPARVSWKLMSTPQVFRQCIEDGLTNATDISEEMGISKGQVSKLAKRAIEAGWLEKKGREYKLRTA